MCTSWLFLHFKFFQGGDDSIGGTTVYQAKNVCVRYFLMHNDIKSYKDNKWKSHMGFFKTKNYTTIHFNNQQQNMLDKKASHIFKKISHSLHDHFNSWANKLLYFALFSECETAKVLAAHLLDLPLHEDASVTYFSPLHNREVSLSNFSSFLATRNVYLYNPFDDLPVSIIYEGLDMWDNDDILPLEFQQLKEFFLQLTLVAHYVHR